MIALYESPPSGNAYKARLMLALLGLTYESRQLKLAAGEQKTPAFLALNPLGQVPVLIDGQTVIRDSQAILVYLAKQYGGAAWWPDEAAQLAGIAAWHSTAANEIAHGIARLRLHHKFGRAIDVEAAQALTKRTLDLIAAQLVRSEFLLGERVSIADLAIYPYVALAPEAHVDLAPFPSILGWFSRIRALHGYIGMDGMWP